MRVLFAAACCFILGWSSLTLADDGKAGYARPDLLLEPSELAKPEVAQQFVVLDVRGSEAYDEAHIPGALRVDHDAWKSAFGDGQDADTWSQLIAELGINKKSQVVVYDDADTKDAARVWWILRYWGVPQARLLNGGWKTWTAEKFPTSSESTVAKKVTSFRAKAHSDRLTSKDELLTKLPKELVQIVDTRSFGEYCGNEPLKNKRGGAIPGAKHLEWSDLIDAETGRFRRAAEIRELFSAAKIDLNRPTATHCQSGGRASVMAFGLELMGAKDVSNYYRGWSEWGNAEETPVEKKDAPEKEKASN